MRLIDADALGIGKANPDVFEEKAYAWGWNVAIDVIKKAPTIDAAPVVRCKDCKHFRPCEEVEGESWTGWCAYGDFSTDNLEFCSRGVRKEITDVC